MMPPTINPDLMIGETSDDPMALEEAFLASAATQYYVLNATPGVPRTYAGAMKRADWPMWQEAIDKELAAHKKYETFKCVEPPPAGTNIAGTRWVFTRKSNGDYKARLVVQGFSQRYGEDYLRPMLGCHASKL